MADKESGKLLTVFSQLVDRLKLSANFGKQYGTDRDLYEALGYPTTITYKDYLAKYTRQDMAKAIIDRPVKVTWTGQVQIIESDDDEETQLEKQWKELEKELGLKSRFIRVDKLAGIGTYGVLLLGLNDVKKKQDFKEPVLAGIKKLSYIKPFGANNAAIHTWEKNTSDPRYGMPLLYNITMSSGESTTASSEDILVHHSRIIHITDDILESEVEGAPRLEVVYNRLMDLEKLVGGDAEMFWRGARPGYAGSLKENYQMTPETKAELQDQIDEFEHNLRRILINEGVDLKALDQQIADPANHVDVQLQMISAVTGIPKRILVGSERGELSSSQDKSEWMAYVQMRREEYAEPRIIRPFVDRCIEYKILPKPKEEYSIQWVDLFALNEKDKIEIGKARSTALKEYTANPMAEFVVPPESFLELFLGLTEEQIEMIIEKRDLYVKEQEEQQATEEEENIIEQEGNNEE